MFVRGDFVLKPGERFSQIYLEKGKPTSDSIRFRNRLGAFYWQKLHDDQHDIVRSIHKELGVKVPFIGTNWSVPVFFQKAEIRDILDSITLIYNLLTEKRYLNKVSEWLQFVERVFREENLGYTVDSKGIVHFFVDEEFERNRFATISCLSLEGYESILPVFEASYRNLDGPEPKTKEAIRTLFEAIEILYKRVIGSEEVGVGRLNCHGVQHILKPLILQQYERDETTHKAADHLLDGLCDWIEAVHLFRHGQSVDENQDPPLDFTVAMMSTGSSYIRWMVNYNLAGN